MKANAYYQNNHVILLQTFHLNTAWISQTFHAAASFTLSNAIRLDALLPYSLQAIISTSFFCKINIILLI